MHHAPAGTRIVFDHGDTIKFTDADHIAKWDEGPHKVLSDQGDTLTILVTKTLTVQKEKVSLHANRPAYMEPGYVKGE